MIEMTNLYTKRYLVKGTALAMFGNDFDYRKDQMSQSEAEQRFDQTWQAKIERVVATADRCDVDLVKEHVLGDSARWITDSAEHRHFKLDGKFFIAQLATPVDCDQLWIVPSAIRDPWTVYVKFAEVPIRQEFEQQAKTLRWKPEELAEKLLLDFLESVTGKQHKRRYLSQEGR